MLQDGQNIWFTISDRQGMLELCREQAIDGSDCPAISFIKNGIGATSIDHWLNGEGHTGPQANPGLA